MTTNDDLFVRVLAQIEREPQRWNQASFGAPCSTAYCFAGWACALEGWRFVEYGRVGRTTGHDGRRASRQAERLLGMRVGSWESAENAHLFDACNTLDDLYRISADLMGIDETTLREKVAAAVADGTLQQVSA